jgi:hypothetical protein
LADAKSELETEQQEKQKKNKKSAEVETKVKILGTSAFNTINPIQKSAPTAEKLIRLITIVFGLIAIFKWYIQFGIAKFMLTESSVGWDLSILEYFLSLILLPVATIVFGCILICECFGYHVIEEQVCIELPYQ